MRIIYVGNPLLRKRSQEITSFDDNLKEFVEELTEMMYTEDGVGLAAPQVGALKRVIVFDDGSGSKAMINPIIVSSSSDTVVMEEGCLSVPGIYADISRPASVKIRYQDADGKVIEEVLEGYAARIVQHETDHLDGRLFIDYLSNAKKIALRPQLVEIMKGNV
ncbi:MAG TPA: peptide deformylase [Kosmotogaceae bacterium]|nr:MAG: Peptide deformylase [Thermotogales bacterium 46_20]HAA84904.1 peptide deformylase [Kosmotogaceae bacterium]